MVVITGFCAEYCVISTYNGAIELGLFPVILKDGIASGQRGKKESIESITNVISHEVLMKLLEEKV